MAEDLSIAQGTKAEQYESLIPQINALIEGETDLLKIWVKCWCSTEGAIWLVLWYFTW